MAARSPNYPAPRLPLERVEVRPIHAAERVRWQALLTRHHYLGAPALVGKRLRYVAHLDGRWLALIAWQSAALKCAARDHWIGWSAVLQYQRLHLIANNARFVILPEARCANLASRVLALNLKRLSADWQCIHGHPLLLAETFVDTARFHGGCYRAANWRFVGTTRGFARQPGGSYTHHGQPKAVALYPLRRNARAWLASPTVHPRWSQTMQSVKLSTAQMEDLHERLRALPDYRKARGLRHRAATVLTIAIAAVLAGNRSYAAMAEWAQRLTQAQLKRVRACYDRRTGRFLPPSEPTLRRMLTHADPQPLEATLSEWLLGLDGVTGQVAVDGKTLRGAVRADGTQVHLLSVLLPDLGVSLNQHEVDAKTNEIPGLPELLEPLDISGQVVSADAMHTQRETARFLVEDKKAHYLFTVKDNQPGLHEDLGDLNWSLFPLGADSLDPTHGRIDYRTIRTTTILNDYLDFPYVGQAFCIERSSTDKASGQETLTHAYAVTSQSPEQASPEQLLGEVRGHWAIENRSHYVRDVTFDEDRSQVRTGNGPRMMAALRNFAISLLRLFGHKNIAKATREFAANARATLKVLGL